MSSGAGRVKAFVTPLETALNACPSSSLVADYALLEEG